MYYYQFWPVGAPKGGEVSVIAAGAPFPGQDRGDCALPSGRSRGQASPKSTLLPSPTQPVPPRHPFLPSPPPRLVGLPLQNPPPNMPWKDKLKQLKGEFDSLVSGGGQSSHAQAPPPGHYQQQQQQPPGYGYGPGPGPRPGPGPGYGYGHGPGPGHAPPNAPPPVPPHPPQQTRPGEQEQQQQQQQQQQPPPVPPHPPATGAASGPVYWRPQFRPDVPVTAEWDAKLGNGPDGWGNQELEHYTANPENAFQ